jgi:hypothetical protein
LIVELFYTIFVCAAQGLTLPPDLKLASFQAMEIAHGRFIRLRSDFGIRTHPADGTDA